MNLFQLDKVNFGYHPSRPVLHDISFSLQQGRNIGLVGESGSGKSTILRLLLGLNRANSGTITFLGEEFTPGNRSFMRRYRKAVQPVFQDPYSSLDPRQRIAIARAIVSRPQVLLADEAVSALDLSTRMRIVDLFKTLSASLTVLLVSHDLGVVAALCQDIVILEQGRVVEMGKTADILANPRHPYTQKLLSSIPSLWQNS